MSATAIYEDGSAGSAAIRDVAADARSDADRARVHVADCLAAGVVAVGAPPDADRACGDSAAVDLPPAPAAAALDLARHPCFSKDGRHKYARIHLPVAPRCNVQCNFCNRDYDCVNESRPGVTSSVLAPDAAVAYLQEMIARRPDITVMGIAGPGDPFANPDETMETLRRTRAAFPDLLLCLATNGLGLVPHIPELAALRVSYVTITINAVDPAISARIYAWVRDGARVRRGVDGARVLLDQQLQALALLREHGIVAKVNSVIVPGINDAHIPEIARVAAAHGVAFMNCIPMLPVEGAGFAALPAPTAEMVARVRHASGAHVPQMSHCARCRADAVGRLGEAVSDETTQTLVHFARAGRVDSTEADATKAHGTNADARRAGSLPAGGAGADSARAGNDHALAAGTAARHAGAGRAAGPRAGAGHTEAGHAGAACAGAAQPVTLRATRPHVAVATQEGLLVNQHLGEAARLAIFTADATTDSGARFVETRQTPPLGTGAQRWNELAVILHDCRAVLAAAAGPTPQRALAAHGIEVIEMEGLIEEGLRALFDDQPIPPALQRRFTGCGKGITCRGSGTGCA